MSTAHIPEPDAHVKAKIDAILKDCRGQIAEKGEVTPVILILAKDEIHAVAMDFTTAREKEQVALCVRELVKLHDADTVLMVHEIWTLPTSITTDVAQSLYAKYGEIAKMPQRIEAVRVAIETKDGKTYDALATIVRQGRVVKLAAPTYRDLSEMQSAGRFSGWFAPPRDVPGSQL